MNTVLLLFPLIITAPIPVFAYASGVSGWPLVRLAAGYATGAARFMRAQDLASQDWSRLPDEQKAELDQSASPETLRALRQASTNGSGAAKGQATPR
jgi:hypothetical protein